MAVGSRGGRLGRPPGKKKVLVPTMFLLTRSERRLLSRVGCGRMIDGLRALLLSRLRK